MQPGAPPPPLLLPKDHKQFLALSQRRHAELQRQQRIFDARNRLIGGDPAAWDIQVRDKKIREAIEKARHESFAAQMKRNDKILCILENRQREDQRNALRALRDFQQAHQRPETRREFDLSDPMALRKERPPRLGDQDTGTSISSLQTFLGEDPERPARIKFQEEQNREWLLQQQREAQQARASRRSAEDRYMKAQMQFEETARRLDEQERVTRRATCTAVKEFNKSQVVELAQRRALERRQEEEDNAAEICHLLRWDLLTENPQQATSSGHLLPHRWKGMSGTELERIRGAQKLQVQEKLRLQEEQRQRERDWDQQMVQRARDSMLVQRQLQREQREARRALDYSNLSLAVEHQLREKAMKAASTNDFSESYFLQFNTRSR